MSCDGFDEPGSPWDYALLAAVGVACLPFIAANAVIFFHRTRRYFRAQGGAILILASSISGLIWISATFIVNFHFPRNHHALLVCPLWSFWLQLTFGFWLWLACQIVRLIHLQQMCQRADSSRSGNSRKWQTLFWALVLWIPGLAFTIAATASDASNPSQKGSVCANCFIQSRWKVCAYTILPAIYFCILGTLLWRTSSIKDYLMELEHSHSFEYSFIMAMVIFLLIGAAIGFTESEKKISGRLFLTFCICSLIFVNFWVRLGWPVYICAFKGEPAMDDFEEKLRLCGADCLNDLCPAFPDSKAQLRTSSLKYSDWILQAINAAMDEASECKERIAQLEQKKISLSARCQQLERSAISARRL